MWGRQPGHDRLDAILSRGQITTRSAEGRPMLFAVFLFSVNTQEPALSHANPNPHIFFYRIPQKHMDTVYGIAIFLRPCGPGTVDDTQPAHRHEEISPGVGLISIITHLHQESLHIRAQDRKCAYSFLLPSSPPLFALPRAQLSNSLEPTHAKVMGAMTSAMTSGALVGFPSLHHRITKSIYPVSSFRSFRNGKSSIISDGRVEEHYFVGHKVDLDRRME